MLNQLFRPLRMAVLTLLSPLWLGYLFATPQISWAAPLGDLAASMAPDTWAVLNTNGISGTTLLAQGSSGNITSDASGGCWDPVGQRAHFIGMDHQPGTVQRHVVYDTATNTWLRLSDPPFGAGSVNHGWESNTCDESGRMLYRMNIGSLQLWRYNMATAQWTNLGAPPSNVMAYANGFPGVSWNAARNQLIVTGAENGSDGVLIGYTPATNSWVRVSSAFLSGFADSVSFAEYSKLHQITLFGNGSTARRMDTHGALNSVAAYPACTPRINRNGIIHADPATGNFVMLCGSGAASWHIYNPVSNSWSTKTVPSGISNHILNFPSNPSTNPTWGAIGIPITDHGVIMYVKCNYGGCAVRLYKAGPFSPPPPPVPDTTPPTVALTAPIAGASVSGSVVTVSAAASDNVGVIGVQFKLGGNNLGAEDTSAPFSVSWDSTLVANGSHTLTAIARDAAGNTTTSAAATVNVSNPASPPPTGSDFITRCAQAGVVRCFGFDSQTEANPYLASGTVNPVVDTTIKASGGGSLKMTIPSNSPANSSGAFSMNFTPGSLNFSNTDPYPVQFGQGEEFYVQWRQRFAPEFLNTVYADGGGWKQAIIGEGDRTGVPAYSCTDLEIVTQNSYQLGIPTMYHSCGVKDQHYEGLEITSGGNIHLQNGPGLNCVYPGPYTEPRCVRYKPDQWMTFQVHIRIGTWYKNNGVYHKDSTIQLWVAEEGQPSRLVIDRDPAKGTGYDIVNLTNNVMKYGKVWLLPYHTGKNPSQAHPTAYTWYDELIVSRNKIADPVAGNGTPTNPPAAPTSLTLQ